MFCLFPFENWQADISRMLTRIQRSNVELLYIQTGTGGALSSSNVSLVENLESKSFFFHIRNLTRSLSTILMQNVKTVIKMHHKAIHYILYIAERISSSVRSLFSKGKGLWREGACCVHVCVWTRALCVYLFVSVLAGLGDPYVAWTESLKPKQTVANSPAAWPLL